jgi:hypothetical protein
LDNANSFTHLNIEVEVDCYELWQLYAAEVSLNLKWSTDYML